jgi:hypothetical protein
MRSGRKGWETPIPNWCINRLAIRGEPQTVMRLVELLEGETPFDFNRVVPMPSGIKGGQPYDAGLPDTFPGWYQWSRENWGVKWNAVEVTRRGFGRTGRVRYRFLTAYGPPTELLDVIATALPGIEMDLEYTVELMMDGWAHVPWRKGHRVRHKRHRHTDDRQTAKGDRHARK